MFASIDLDSNLGGNLYSHLPLKKRLIRDMAQHPTPPTLPELPALPALSALPALPAFPTFATLPASPVINLFAATEPEFHPISIGNACSLSPCSSTSSETCSMDSGFGDIEPLDLSFNSTPVKKLKSTEIEVSFPTKPSLVCPECGKLYESSSRFRAHLRRHESKTSGRYRCGVCSKNFVQRSSLKTHERIHTGEKPYHCQLCDERFGDFSTYTKHRRTHTGEKPYSCPVCGRSFSQSGNMHRHLKVVHKPHLDLYREWCDQLK